MAYLRLTATSSLLFPKRSGQADIMPPGGLKRSYWEVPENRTRELLKFIVSRKIQPASLTSSILEANDLWGLTRFKNEYELCLEAKLAYSTEELLEQARNKHFPIQRILIEKGFVALRARPWDFPPHSQCMPYEDLGAVAAYFIYAAVSIGKNPGEVMRKELPSTLAHRFSLEELRKIARDHELL